METHSFTIIASTAGSAADDEIADRLFEVGCDDATLSLQKAVLVLEFERAARTFTTALLSAVCDVERAGLQVERIEPDYLVNASDIAKRSGLGRAAISLYASGSRGRGFPSPVARVTTDSPLWDWVEVASWMHREKKLPLDVAVQARVMREVNRVVVEKPRSSPRITKKLERELETA